MKTFPPPTRQKYEKWEWFLNLQIKSGEINLVKFRGVERNILIQNFQGKSFLSLWYTDKIVIWKLWELEIKIFTSFPLGNYFVRLQADTNWLNGLYTREREAVQQRGENTLRSGLLMPIAREGVCFNYHYVDGIGWQ